MAEGNFDWYDELLRILEPRLGDFTGVTDKGEFDIILAVKEVIEELEERVSYLEGKKEELESLAKRLNLSPSEEYANFDCIDAVLSYKEEELGRYKGICKRAGLVD